MRVKIKYLGKIQYLLIGGDRVECIPVSNVKQIDYRRLSFQSWVTITHTHGEIRINDHLEAVEFIDWFEAADNPVEGELDDEDPDK